MHRLRFLVVLGVFVSMLAVGCGQDGDVGTAGTGGGNGGAGGTADGPWPPDATVYFDAEGVFNAECATDEDCAMALGYYHAKERFVQMDLRRRFTTGRLTDLLSKVLATGLALPAAISNRALFSTRSGMPGEDFLLSQATPKTIALLEAYSVGVNRWLDDLRNGRNGAEFPREFQHALLTYEVSRIPDWQPSDCLAAVLALIESLTNDESLESRNGIGRAAIGDDARFQDLYGTRPIKESSVLPPGTYSEAMPSGSLAAADVKYKPRRELNAGPALRQYAAMADNVKLMKGMLGLERGTDTGSNNWVVGPARSAGGNALLSNDPHLAMTQPATWYIAHLDAKTRGTGDLHVAGVTFAGLPYVIIGQNEDIAWGATTTVFDHSDVYIEELVVDGNNEPMGVMFEGAVVPFTRVNADFDFDDGTVQTEELLFVPHHGPVRSIDVENGVATTLRWTGNDVDTDAEFPLEMGRASDIDEAIGALRNVTSLGQNWVVIDKDNNFGWFPYNRLPTRPWATGLDGAGPAWVPVDGTGAFEWGPAIPYENLPQVRNPNSGYVATANNDMTGALFDGDPTNDGHALLQSFGAAGYRHARIVELIEETPGAVHDAASMLRIVGDVYSLIGADMTPAILAIANDAQTTLTPNGQKVVNALTGWDFQCTTGLDGEDSALSPLTSDATELAQASGCAAFHVALREIDRAVLGDDAAEIAQQIVDAGLADDLDDAFGFVPGQRGPSFATFYSLLDPTQLRGGDVYWDNRATDGPVETKYQVIAEALDAAGGVLVDRLGANEAEWAWGRLHGLILATDLDGLGISDFNNVAPGGEGYANDGGLFTVDVANPTGNFTQRAGPSMRLVCEAQTGGPSCTIQLPGGQSGHFGDPNYQSLLSEFLTNTPRPLNMDIDAAAASAAITVAGADISP